MAYHRIAALVIRHLYLYRRSLPRVMEIIYWPFLDLVVWGFITVYLATFQGQMPAVVTFLLGALILAGCVGVVVLLAACVIVPFF